MPDTRHYFQVLVAMPSGQAVRGYGQRMLDGIIDFARQRGDWRFPFKRVCYDAPDLLDQIGHWDGLVGLPIEELRRRTLDQGRPGVLAVRVDDCPMPQVYPDDPEVGRMAYRYLRSLGFRNLAFIGLPGVAFSDDRENAFLAAARADGLDVSIAGVGQGPEHNAEWIASLETPAGLFCVNARVARDVAEMCEARGVRVPQDVALLGCGHDPHVCELAWPPLSTIDHASREIGFRAAEMLDTLMRGGKLEKQRVLIPPIRIIERQSTNTLAIEDANVAEALHYIRAHACEGINVQDVMKHVPASRRNLERAFRKHVKMGILEEITRVRLRRARELLVESDLPTPDIAARSGFSSASKLSAVFRRELDLTPTQYRRTRRR
jgi:LacI family transcriptional regulator